MSVALPSTSARDVWAPSRDIIRNGLKLSSACARFGRAEESTSSTPHAIAAALRAAKPLLDPSRFLVDAMAGTNGLNRSTVSLLVLGDLPARAAISNVGSMGPAPEKVISCFCVFPD